jgi:hypothetical protein
MPKKILPIDPSGGVPVVSVEVKFPQLGQYDVTLWNDEGKKPRSVGRGNNADEIDDEFGLVANKSALAGLEGFQVTWVIWIQRLSPDAKSKYEFRFRITQDGKVIGEDRGQGTMDSTFKPFRGTYVIRLSS